MTPDQFAHQSMAWIDAISQLLMAIVSKLLPAIGGVMGAIALIAHRDNKRDIQQLAADTLGLKKQLSSTRSDMVNNVGNVAKTLATTIAAPTAAATASSTVVPRALDQISSAVEHAGDQVQDSVSRLLGQDDKAEPAPTPPAPAMNDVEEVNKTGSFAATDLGAQYDGDASQ